jgi:NAD(P)-dependent dehydrogenase (short-subunit alcohol dehydrogenase family)
MTMNELRFDDKVAVVTGAGGGIGRAHALLLASRGARVVVADLGCEIDGTGSSPDPANGVVSEIEASGGVAVASHASVADEEGAASIVATALNAFGRLDVVINNAGIFAPGRFETLSSAQFRSMFDVHFFGTLFMTKAAWPHLIDAGSGRIVNTTSESFLGMDLLSSYGSAKAAIFGLTRNVAVAGEPHGIAANCLSPRAGTRMAIAHSEAMKMPPEVTEQAAAFMPPEAIAPAGAYLAHASCALNGETFFVGPNHISRLAVINTRGIKGETITSETIAERLDEIMDTADAQVTDVHTRLT